jgi:hypothetical protein
LREAKATARIRNTGAITVYDVVKEDDRPWIVMELIEGRSLSDAIREDGPLTPRRAAQVGLVVLDVLSAAHREGILHRDVKPSNVLIADDSRVVLGDFGIAQIDGDPSVTSTGMLVGAPSYISPERARGHKPGPPADLWSLGALLFASVEGRPPYDKGSAIATLTAVMTEPVGPMVNAGPLAPVITGLLAKDPDERLDEQGARALLETVANAPDRPVAPSAPSGETRTALLPVDPQPTPTDALPETRAAAADQARVRDALRSVRKAAAKARSAPAPEPGVPAGTPVPARASLTDVVPRRTLVIAAVAVVIALLGTVIGVALANSGGGGGDSKNGGTSTSGTQNGKKQNGGAGGKPPASSSATASATAGADDSAGSGGSGDSGDSGDDDAAAGGASAGPDTVPAGFHRVPANGGASVAIPDGWTRLPDHSDYPSGTYFSGPGGGRLMVDWTPHPGPSALADWQDHAAHNSFADYQQVKIEDVPYRTYDAADWEYKYAVKGKQVHSLNRGMVTDAHHGYALLFTFPDDAWNSHANRLVRTVVFDTFKPAK